MSAIQFKDTLEFTTPVLGRLENNTTTEYMWIGIAMIEFLLILVLLYKMQKMQQYAKAKTKAEILEQRIDFDNVINSSFNSVQLYNKLKAKCHPDKFAADIEKNAIAEALFQEIVENKTNANKLYELKERAEEYLDINF